MRKVFLAVAASMAVAAVVVPTAQASKWCVSKSGDGSLVCARDGADAGTGGHEYVDICDQDADGHYAYARVGVIWLGAKIYWTSVTTEATGTEGYDRNGSTAGCSTYDFSGMRANQPGFFDGIEPAAIAVCVQAEGCSPFKWHDGTLDPVFDGGYQAWQLPRVAG
jgi:hypothetical protein